MRIITLIGYWLLFSIAGILGGLDTAYTTPPAVTDSAITSPDQTLILIREEEFLPDEWTISAEASAGASYSVTRQLNGGFANSAFRLMSHRIPPVIGEAVATIRVTHIYSAHSYDPGTQGALLSLDYQEAGIILSFPFDEAFTTSQPVVMQNGRIFRSTKFLRFIAVNSSHTWEFKSLSNLVAADFVAIDGSGDNPDFSANGALLQLGFTRSNSRSATLPPVPGNEDLVIDHGVDNLQWILRREIAPQENHPPQAVDDTFILDGSRRILPLLEFFGVADNDTDPDNDRIKVVEVQQPLYGSVGILADHTVVYQLDEARASDSFQYTISDDEFTSSAKAAIYIDCACTVLCLNSLELPEAAGGDAGQAIDLPLIYRVRDQVLSPTAHGQRYIDMYYESNPEILVNIVTNEQLRNDALATIELWQAPLRNLTDGDGSAAITQEQVDALQALLNDLFAVSSTELQQIITLELLRLGPLDDYVGLSMKEAKRRAIGDAIVRLPQIQAP